MALLYPPILLDSAPAFIGNSFKIFFELSQFNSINDININAIQITVIKQSTNTSIIKTASGIKMASLQISNDEQYYISINESDLRNPFEQNQFYKIQIRFTSKDLNYNPETQKNIGTSWFYDNKGYFSQWSKVCLIKNISKPTLYINGFNDNVQKTTFNSSMFSISGHLNFNQNEKEYLKSYQIKIYPIENPNNIVLNTDEIYTNINDPNTFYYEVEEELLNSLDYTMQFTYITNNGYTETKTYNFIIIEYGFDALDVTLAAFSDEENGRIIVKIIPTINKDFIGNLTIRRTSSKSNFHKWEDIKNYTFLEKRPLDFSFYDSTIESGVWYKYGIQKRNSFGDRGILIQLQEPVICIFQHIFISNGTRQLKIKFNPSLNQFKYNVNEIQQNTIGSKYPYIKRNGANYFRSFPIGGLISSLSDTTDWYDPHFIDGAFNLNQNELKLFTSKEEIYSESIDFYQNYNQNNQINEYNDYIYQRNFREKVYEFLYQHNVKLFRSTTEGNILIKLMNIDFQPIEALGRRLYSFTASAVEIDEANIKNYDKYNIQKIGKNQSQLIFKEEIFGQVSKTFKGSENILNQINNKYKNFTTQGFQSKISSLKHIKIEIESDPYVIIEQNGKLKKGDNNKNTIGDAFYGHIININGNEIIVYPRIQRRVTFSPKNNYLSDNINEDDFTKNTDIIYLSIFELDNVSINLLNFKYDTTATITYIANSQEVESNKDTIKNYYYYKKIGQLYGTFLLNQNLIKKIYDKYFQKYNDYYQQLLQVKNIQIEVPPGTICYIKDSKDSNYNKHIIENGFLRLKDESTSILGLYFEGIQLKQTNNKKYLRKDEYYINPVEYNNIQEVKNPIHNYVYTINPANKTYIQGIQQQNSLIIDPDFIEYIQNSNDSYYRLLLNLASDDLIQDFIYYNNSWYPFDKNNGVIYYPIQGIVNYRCDIIKGEYR